MISFLRGILVSKAAQSPKGAYFLVDVNGVGYEVASSSRSVEAAPQAGETSTIFTSLIVREDAMSLVGFNTREERDLFNILHSAQGVGPRVALAILSALSVPEIAQAVMSGNFKILTSAKGVGPKLAERVTVDLKEKMSKWRQLEGKSVEVWNSQQNTQKLSSKEFEARHEAENVLLSLGYGIEEIARSFDNVAATLSEIDNSPGALAGDNSELWLREALRWLATANV